VHGRTYGALEVFSAGVGEGSCDQDGGGDEVTHYEDYVIGKYDV
jgi:hypothetical protein